MKATCTSETSVDFQRNAWRNVPQVCTIRGHGYHNFKSKAAGIFFSCCPLLSGSFTAHSLSVGVLHCTFPFYRGPSLHSSFLSGSFTAHFLSSELSLPSIRYRVTFCHTVISFSWPFLCLLDGIYSTDSGGQSHRHLWADRRDNVGSSTSHNPIGFHGLLRR
jgi:hypothetical protein